MASTFLARLTLASLFAAPLLASASQPVEPTERIEQVVEHHLQEAFSDEDSEIRLGTLDPRLRLARCAEKPEAFFPHGNRPSNGSLSVGVRCHAPAAWTIYMPASVVQFEEVVVATRPVTRGDHIRRSDLSVERREITASTRSWFSDPDEVAAMVARRPIQNGTVIASNMVEPPTLVKRRDQITIVAGGAAFQVRMKGVALGDGAMGDRIKVRSKSSRREIDAVVTAPGEVRVM